MSSGAIQTILLEYGVSKGYSKVLADYPEAFRSSLNQTAVPTSLHLRVVLYYLEREAKKANHKKNELAVGLITSLLDLDHQVLSSSLLTKTLLGLQLSVLFDMLQRDDKNVLAKLNTYFPSKGFSHPNVESKLVTKLTSAQKNFRKFFIPLIAHRVKRVAYMSGDYKIEFGEGLLKKSIDLLNQCCEKLHLALPPTAFEKLRDSQKEGKLSNTTKLKENVLFKSFLDEIKDDNHMTEEKVLDLLEKFTKPRNKKTSLSELELDSSSDKSLESSPAQVKSPPVKEVESEKESEEEVRPRRGTRRNVAPKKYAESSSEDNEDDSSEEDEDESEVDEEVITLSSTEDTDESSAKQPQQVKRVVSKQTISNKKNKVNKNISSDTSAFQVEKKARKIKMSQKVKSNVDNFDSTASETEEKMAEKTTTTEGEVEKEVKHKETPKSSKKKGTPKIVLKRMQTPGSSKNNKTPRSVKNTVRTQVTMKRSLDMKEKEVHEDSSAESSKEADVISKNTTPKTGVKTTKSTKRKSLKTKGKEILESTSSESEGVPKVATPKNTKKTAETPKSTMRNAKGRVVLESTSSESEGMSKAATPRSTKKIAETPGSTIRKSLNVKGKNNLDSTSSESEGMSKAATPKSSRKVEETPKSTRSKSLKMKEKSESDCTSSETDGVSKTATPKSSKRSTGTPRSTSRKHLKKKEEEVTDGTSSESQEDNAKSKDKRVADSSSSKCLEDTEGMLKPVAHTSVRKSTGTPKSVRRKSLRAKDKEIDDSTSSESPEETEATSKPAEPKSGQKFAEEPKNLKRKSLRAKDNKVTGSSSSDSPVESEVILNPAARESGKKSTETSSNLRRKSLRATDTENSGVPISESKATRDITKPAEARKTISDDAESSDLCQETTRRTLKRRSECSAYDSTDSDRIKSVTAKCPSPAKIARLRSTPRSTPCAKSTEKGQISSDESAAAGSATPKTRSEVAKGKSGTPAKMTSGAPATQIQSKTPTTKSKSGTPSTKTKVVTPLSRSNTRRSLGASKIINERCTGSPGLQKTAVAKHQQSDVRRSISPRRRSRLSDLIASSSEESIVIPVYTPNVEPSISSRITRKSLPGSSDKLKRAKRSLPSSAGSPVNAKRQAASPEVYFSAKPSCAPRSDDESDESWQTCSEPDLSFDEADKLQKKTKDAQDHVDRQSQNEQPKTRSHSSSSIVLLSTESSSSDAGQTSSEEVQEKKNTRRKSSIKATPTADKEKGGGKLGGKFVGRMVSSAKSSSASGKRKLSRRPVRSQITALTSSDSEIEVVQTVAVASLSSLKKLSPANYSPLPDMKRHMKSPLVKPCLVLLTKKMEVSIGLNKKKTVVRF